MVGVLQRLFTRANTYNLDVFTNNYGWTDIYPIFLELHILALVDFDFNLVSALFLKLLYQPE